MKGKSNKAKSKLKLKIVISSLLFLSLLLFALPFSKYFIIATHTQFSKTTIQTQLPSNTPPTEEIQSLNIRDVLNSVGKTSDSAIGQVVIPKVTILQPIFVGLTTQNMINGVVSLFPERHPDSGSLTLIGHHASSNSLLFARIDELEKGDPIYLQYFNYYYQYDVEKTALIKETEVNQLADKGADTLFLVTCNQEENTPYRILVEAKKADEDKVDGQQADAGTFSQHSAIIKKTERHLYLVKFILPLLLIIVLASLFLIFVWRS